MPASSPDGKIEVIGLSQTVSKLKRLETGVSQELKQIGYEAAQPVVSEARSIAPVRTGKLQASIRALKLERGAAIRTGNKTSLSYGSPIHWGWFIDRNTGKKRNIKPNPFLFRAFGIKRQDVIDTYERNMRKLIDKYGL